MAEILRLCGLGKKRKTTEIRKVRTMKINLFCLLVVVALALCTTGCVMLDKSSSGATIPGPHGNTVVTNKANKIGVGLGWLGSFVESNVQLNASVGGLAPMGSQYGYGGSYGYYSRGTYVQSLPGPQPINGWPVETHPSWMQGADWHRTQEMYRGSRIQSGGGFHY